MKYNVIAYLLAFQGEVEATDENDLEQKIKKACNYPPAGPIIIHHVEEVEENKNTGENV